MFFGDVDIVDLGAFRWIRALGTPRHPIWSVASSKTTFRARLSRVNAAEDV
jgi:hypothetical protein